MLIRFDYKQSVVLTTEELLPSLAADVLMLRFSIFSYAGGENGLFGWPCVGERFLKVVLLLFRGGGGGGTFFP